MKKVYIFVSATLLCSTLASAQIGIGTTTPNAALDITSSTNGVLVPRVGLTAKNVSAPVINPQGGGLTAGTLVWNTATAGTSPNNVLPGFYYWDGSVWVSLAGANSNNWTITGNTGTSAATNYVGTADAVDFRVATSGTERMRATSAGQVVVNNTTPAAGDRFSVYGAANDFAVNGYSTGTGFGVYGQNTATGVGIFGLNNSSGYGVYGSNTGTSYGVVGVSSASIGVYGVGNAALGTGVYGTSSGTTGTGVFGYSTGTASDGVYGQSTVALGNGVWGVGNAGTGTGVFGSTTGANGTGVWGTATKAAGIGVIGQNSNASGSGVVGAGNGAAATFLTLGSGGAFSGTGTGAVGWATATANGVGVMGAGNNTTATTIGTVGAGGAFIGKQWGTTSIANISGAGNNATDRAAFIGNYVSAGATQETVYVGARIGGTHYKILGTNAGSVSTTMKTDKGERILFAPEAPENWFFDVGEAMLVDGKATVRLDPIFIQCISDSKPFKVFVQGGENTLGSIRVTRNQDDKSFVLEDLGGASNGTVQYSIYAIWKTKENLRFPELKDENKPRQEQAQTQYVPSKPARDLENPRKPAAAPTDQKR